MGACSTEGYGAACELCHCAQVATALVYLSEVESGGHTIFPYADHWLKANQEKRIVGQSIDSCMQGLKVRLPAAPRQDCKQGTLLGSRHS